MAVATSRLSQINGQVAEKNLDLGGWAWFGRRSSPGTQRKNIGPLRPSIPLSSHGSDPLGIPPGKIELLGSIRAQIVELPGLIFSRNQLPTTVAKSAVSLMLPNQRANAMKGPPDKSRPQTHAFQRFKRIPRIGLRIASPGHIQASGHNIDELAWV